VFAWIVRCYECVGYLVWLGGCENVTAARRTGARTDNLAQASQARLTETGKGLPKPFARDVAQVGGLCFEREIASLKRGELA